MDSYTDRTLYIHINSILDPNSSLSINLLSVVVYVFLKYLSKITETLE